MAGDIILQVVVTVSLLVIANLIALLLLGLRYIWLRVTDRGREVELTPAIPEPPYRQSVRDPQEYIGRKEMVTMMIAMSRKVHGYEPDRIEPNWYSIHELMIATSLYWKLYRNCHRSMTKSQWEAMLPEGGRDFLLWMIHDLDPEDKAIVDLGPGGVAEAREMMQRGQIVPRVRVTTSTGGVIIGVINRLFGKA